MIRNKNDYNAIKEIHQRYYFHTVVMFILSVLIGVLAVSSVYHGYTPYSLLNWTIFTVLFIISFVMLIQSKADHLEAKKFELELESYRKENNLKKDFKSVDLFLKQSQTTIFVIAGILYLLYCIIS